MTIPSERTMAVIAAEGFLTDLLNPRATPRVPKAIRRKAASVLRHYPVRYYLVASHRILPDIWGPVE